MSVTTTSNFSVAATNLATVSVAWAMVANPDSYAQLATETGVWASTNEQAISEAFGLPLVATTPEAKAALGVLARMYLRQPEANRPFNSEDYLQMIKGAKGNRVAAHGVNVDLLALKHNLVKSSEAGDSEISNEITKSKMGNKKACNSMANAIADVKSGKAVIVPASYYEMVVSFLNEVEAKRVLTLNDNWGNPFAFTAQWQDVVCVLAAIAEINPSVKLTEVNASFYEFTVNRSNTLVVTPRGVTDKNSGKAFGKMILSSATTLGSTVEQAPESLTKLNQFGTALYALLSGAQYWTTPGKLFRFATEGLHFPLNGIKESGGDPFDSGRRFYNDNVAIARAATIGLPVCKNGNTVSSKDSTPSIFKPKTALISVAVYQKFSLVETTGGTFTDSRDSVLKAADMGADDAKEMFSTIFNKAGVKANTWVNEVFKLDTQSEAEALDWMAANGGLGLSNKLAKLIKRCNMDRSAGAMPVRAASRGFLTRAEYEAGYAPARNMLALRSAFSLSTNLSAGMAVWLAPEGETLENSVTAVKVPHTQSVECVTEEVVGTSPKLLGQFSDAKVTVDADGWSVASFSNLFTASGTPFVSVPVQTEAGVMFYSLLTEKEEGYVTAIKWISTKADGNTSVLTFKVVTHTLEAEHKVRSNVKAMLGKADPSVFLPEALREYNGSVISTKNGLAVFPRDSVKAGDKLVSLTDTAAFTFIQNNDEKGLAFIKEANAAIGVDESKFLVFCPVACAMGTYEEMTEYFFSKYGRPMWTQIQDSDKGELSFVLDTMYQNWTEVTLEGVFPEGAINPVLLSQQGADYSDVDTLLGFYTLNGKKFILQRGWAYVGTQESPVWTAVKAEVSTVTTSVGTSSVMSSVIREVAATYPKVAANLRNGGKARLHRAGAFGDMLEGNTIKGTKSITVDKIRDLLSPELVSQLVSPVPASDLFKQLAVELSAVTIAVSIKDEESESGIRTYSLYIPAVYQQDSNRDQGESGGLSSLVQTAITLVAMGAKTGSLFSRIFASLKVTCAGKGMGKSAAFGSKGAYGKSSANPVGVPIGQIWVRESSSTRSIEATIKKVYGSNYSGKVVGVTRAPMTVPMYCRLIRIEKTDARWAFLNEFSFNLSPLAMLFNGGDNDGDTVTVWPATGAVTSTLSDLLKMIADKTGADALFPVPGNYIGDQFHLPSAKEQNKKMGRTPDAILSHIMRLTPDRSDTSMVTRGRNYLEMTVASSEAFNSNVGTTHKGMYAAEVLKTLFDDLTVSSEFSGNASAIGYLGFDFSGTRTAVSTLSEIYENCLGGLDWAMYDFVQSAYEPTLKCEDFIPFTGLEAAGVSEQFSGEMDNLVEQAGKSQILLDASKSDEHVVDGLYTAILAITQVTVLMSKGVAREEHNALVKSLVSWTRDESNTATWATMQSLSPTVAAVEEWLQVAQGCDGERQVDVSFLIPTTKSAAAVQAPAEAVAVEV